jgi:hypothetical protein
MSMRPFLVALLLLAAPFANAAGERKYAVLSLIGDRLLIVTHDMQTGSRLDKNQRSYANINNPVLDNGTAFAIEDAIKQAQPGSEVVLLGARDAKLFASQADMLEGKGASSAFLASLRAALGNLKATHLIVATKYRHEAMLEFSDGNVGSGQIEGLGFYIDHLLRVTNQTTQETATGFLAPFAYFRLSLVDLSNWQVLREDRVMASQVRSAASSASGHPWAAMSAQEKVNSLEQMVRYETLRVVPALLQ